MIIKWTASGLIVFGMVSSISSNCCRKVQIEYLLGSVFTWYSDSSLMGALWAGDGQYCHKVQDGKHNVCFFPCLKYNYWEDCMDIIGPQLPQDAKTYRENQVKVIQFVVSFHTAADIKLISKFSLASILSGCCSLDKLTIKWSHILYKSSEDSGKCLYFLHLLVNMITTWLAAMSWSELRRYSGHHTYACVIVKTRM